MALFLSALAFKFQNVGRFLIIALDEIGLVFPGASEFFNVLRDVFNSRQAEPRFKHITFLLAGVFHPRDLVEDDNISPFNVARRVRLHDFTLEQTRSLIGSFASGEQADILATRVYHWVSGQPYLTQQLCVYLRPHSTPADVDRAIERLRREDENHLAPLLKRIRTERTWNSFLTRITAGEQIEFKPSMSKPQAQLELLGIIKADGDGHCVFRCRVYEQSLGQPIGPKKRIPAENKTQTRKARSRLTASAPPPRNTESETIGLAPKPTKAKSSAKLVILFLAADPSDAARLRLGD